jgi:hypothetical protein
MKINELTAKAFDKAIPYTWHSLDHIEVEKLLNVFAELIVGECTNAIVNDSRLNDVSSAANGCVRTIKQHFGVEE